MNPEALIQNTTEWLEMRRKYIGASDSPACLDLSPYTSKYELWLDKVGIALPKVENERMKEGKSLESEALKWFNKLNVCEFKPHVVFHNKHKFMMASLDGMTRSPIGDRILEIKCNGKSTHEKVKNGHIPEHHYCQMQHQMECANVNECWYLSYVPGDERITVVERDDDFIKRLIKEEEQFWYCVENFVSPLEFHREYITQDAE